MSYETKTDGTSTSDEIEAIAADFAAREFTPDELAKIKRTRRRSPRIGETRAEVCTFRAPHSYKSRIKQRAASDKTTESQVIRDALDSYL